MSRRNSWENSIASFLSKFNFGYPKFPKLISSVFEFYCYINRVLEMRRGTFTIKPMGLSPAGEFRVHYKPGNVFTSSHFLIFRNEEDGAYGIFMNIGIPGKSGVRHHPDISILYYRTFEANDDRTYGRVRDSYLVSISECKLVSKLQLVHCREFLGYLVELNHFYIVPPIEKHIRDRIYTYSMVSQNIMQIVNRYDFDIEEPNPY